MLKAWSRDTRTDCSGLSGKIEDKESLQRILLSSKTESIFYSENKNEAAE